MNKVYRLIWSETRQTWVVAHEHANSRGKPSRIRPAAAVLMGVLASFGSHAQVPAPGALPTGGQVVGGQASIATSGVTMNIQQSSQRAILNWQSFNIGANAAVNFQQPNAGAVALNRVIGSDPSAIYGSLNANGQVFLLNPSGVVFGPGARVDVGGLVASTLNMRNEDFLSGNYRLTRDGFSGSVINQGDLLGQYVALLAPEVRNEGVIVARQGTAALAGGDAVTLSIAGSNLVGVQVDKASIDTLVENRRLIQADAGLVVLSAQSAHSLVGKVVNTGTIEAGGISTDGGVVRLVASSAIELGGTVNADAGANGKGGTVIAIADLANPASRTDFTGTISAKGGTVSGDGGFVETSASNLKVADSARVDTRAAQGRSGEWLLDPTDFTVAASGGDITGATLGTNLATSDVTIQSGTGASGTNGDVFVNDTVSWSSNQKLTLRAHRSINVNAAITASGGTGSGVAMEFGQALTMADPPPVSGPELLNINAPINLTANSSYSVKFRSDGVTDSYTVIADETALRGIANMSGKFALGANIDASGSAWTTIGTDVAPFAGIFDGLGHTVSGINLDSGNGSNIGMFGSIDFTGIVSNLKLTGVDVKGMNNVGALAGQNSGLITRVSASGSVTGQDTTGTDTNIVTAIGGLVGFNQGTIGESSSSVNVSAISGDQEIFEASGSSGGIGGLVGVQSGAPSGLIHVYATGSVTGKNNVGGLVGFSDGTIGFAYSTGAVSVTTAATTVGGLVGAVGFITGAAPGLWNETYWDTTTSGQATSASGGGNASTGKTTAEMKTAATFTGWDTTNVWTITDGSYPTLGVVSGGGGGGGPVSLVVSLDDLFRFYGDTSQPTFTGFSFTGTLLAGDSFNGYDWGIALTDYLGAGTYAYTTTDLITPNFTFAGGHSLANYSITLPTTGLTVTPRPITVTAQAQNKVYNGQGGADPALLAPVVTSAQPGGGLVNGDSLSGALLRAVGSNVGDYAIGQNTLTAGGNYSITYVPANFSIIPKPVTLTAPAVTKTYDGGLTYTTIAGDLTALSGQLGVGGDSITAATIAYTNKNAGTGDRTVTLDAVTISDGNGGNNYSVTRQGNSTSTITPKAVTLTAPDVTKTYDGGLTYTTIAGDLTALSGQLGVGGDSITAATIAYTNKNAGTGDRTVTLDAVTISDGNGGNNYSVTRQGNSTSTINKADLTLGGTRVYDATTIVAGDVLTATGVNGETFAMTGSGDASNLASKNVQTGATLNSVTGLALGASGNGGDANNYNAITITGSSVTIIKKTLDVSAPPAASSMPGGPTPVADTLVKIYDGSSVATVTGVSLKPEASIGTASAGRAYAGDAVTLNTGGATGQFRNAGNAATANVADATKVVITGLTLSGADSGNYELAATPEMPGAIQQRTVTLSATKTYDGLATLTGSQVTIGTGVGGETLNYTGATASSPDVATAGKFINAITLQDGTGGVAGNYRLPVLNAGNAPVTINPADLVLTGSRVYDGSTVVAGSVLTATGVNGETFAMTGAGDASNLASKNVQTNVALNSLTNLALGTSVNGGVETNYNPISTTGSQVTIAPATLTYLADAASRNTGQPNPAFTGSVSGFVPGEDEGNATTGTRTFTSAAGIATPAGSYAINGSGLTATDGNYIFAQAPGNATALTIRAGAQDGATSTAIQQAVETTRPTTTTTRATTTTTRAPTSTVAAAGESTTTTQAPPAVIVMPAPVQVVFEPGEPVQIVAETDTSFDQNVEPIVTVSGTSSDPTAVLIEVVASVDEDGNLVIDVIVPEDAPEGIVAVTIVAKDSRGVDRTLVYLFPVQRTSSI